MKPAEWVAIAVLGRTRGNRGEVVAIPLAGRPERFESLRRVWLFGEDPAFAEGAEYEIESVWVHDGKPVLKFRGVDSISAAEVLTGTEVRVPAAERMPLEEGAFYASDLIGCAVVEQKTNQALGHVADWQDTGGAGLLEVRTPAGGELLIPFARSICVEIDPAARRILVDLPEGLKDLNPK